MMVPLEIVVAVCLAVALVASILALRSVDVSSHWWGDRLRSRLLFGVPWGTLVVVAFVLAVYLFVQDGITDFDNPVVLPYRAWSYFYPLGMATASFTHASSSHLIGNLVGTLVAAPIAEYAWGHYPRDREEESTESWLTNPWIRAFVVFPLAVIAIGLVVSLFALGPVIGFSGVVYAFAGFSIVRYPIATLVATIGVQSVLSTTYRALTSAVFTYQAQPRPPSTPGWATTAIQGHALGFLLGVLLAIAVFSRRRYRPNPLHLWIALLVFGFSKGLWAIYWFEGGNTYVLFRGPGVVVVTALAIVVTLAVVASDRPLLPPSLRGRSAEPESSPARVERILELGLGGHRADARGRIRRLARGSPSESRLRDVTRKGAALSAVVLVVALISGPAIPANLFAPDASTNPDAAIDVRDYSVSYAEGVENEMISIVDVSAFGQNTTIESSGVIVSSADRNIWIEAVSAQRLAFDGGTTVEVGGPGWRETVHVERDGWTAAGNDTAYQVWLWADGDDRQLAHTSDPVRAEVRIEGRNVSVVPGDDGAFTLEVEGPGGAVSSVPIPAENATAEANGLTFEHDDGTVFAKTNGTVVPVASEE